MLRGPARQEVMLEVCLDCTRNSYFAGLLDGEGYVGIRTVRRKGWITYAPQVQIGNCFKGVLDEGKSYWGGCISYDGSRAKPVYKWQLTTRQCEKFLLDVLPYLRIKRAQALIVLELQSHINDRKSNGLGKGSAMDIEEIEYRKSLQDQCKQFNQRKFHGVTVYEKARSIGGACLDCGCMLPANEHNDKRHITYQDYQKGDRADNTTAEVNKVSLSQARANMRKTLAAISSGKLSPNKRK